GVRGRLPVIVSMHVDPARRHQQAVGIDHPPPRPSPAADCGDLAAIDGDIAVDCRGTSAVDDSTAANDDVVHGWILSASVGPLLQCKRARLRSARADGCRTRYSAHDVISLMTG